MSEALHAIDKAKAEQHARLIEQMRRILGSEICAVFEDPSAVEIMLNDDGRVLVERHGQGITELTAMPAAKAVNLLGLMASYRETTVGRDKPIVEGAMPPEFRRARFAGCIPPLTPTPTFAIRLPATKIFTLDDYVSSGILTEEQRGKLVAAIDGRKNILVSGGTGCHAKGHPILMADGSIKPVEDVVVGDKVMGPDSRPRTVVRLHRGQDQMYRIQPGKGDAFVVNAGHILPLSGKSIVGGNLHELEITAEEAYKHISQHPRSQRLRCLVLDSIAYKLRRTGIESFGASKPLIVDPYFLGVLIGDGCLLGSVQVTKSDQEIVDEVYRQAEKYDLKVRVTTHWKNGKHSYFLVQKEGKHGRKGANRLVMDMRALGLMNKRGWEKFIPSEYKAADREVRLQLLAGLLDTDGHYDLNNSFNYYTASPVLAKDVALLAESLSFGVCIKKCLTKSKKAGHMGFSLTLSGNLHEIPTRIPRKQADVRKKASSWSRSAFTIEPHGYGEYYGFEIDGDHLYVDGDFIVHHNSGKTTFLNALSDHIAKISGLDQRIVIIEDGRELVCNAPNTVQMLTDPDAGIDMTRLLKLTLRYRPDRIFVGEVRDGAALALLKAWGTGHPGGLATLHANNPTGALTRLDQLCQEAGVPSQMHLIQEAVDVVVQIARDSKAPAGRRISDMLFLSETKI